MMKSSTSHVTNANRIKFMFATRVTDANIFYPPIIKYAAIGTVDICVIRPNSYEFVDKIRS
jgi:hypothetical protein